MKKIFTFMVGAACAVVLASCAGDDVDAGVPASAETRVRFAIRSSLPAQMRGPVYTAGEFRILAFRKNASGTEYTYFSELPAAGMNYDGTQLTGTAEFPAGDYKFLPSYGLVTEGNYTWPVLEGAPLSDELYVTHTAESFPEVFMLNTSLDAVPVYTLSLDGPLQTVSATLRRAVSRVDVLFLRADKDQTTGAYTQKAGENVFGPEQLASAQMQFTHANNKLGLSGDTVDGVFDVTHTISPVTDVLTIGTGTATTVGTDGYAAYDDVAPADIMTGSAHLRGTYLIPNADQTAATGLTIKLTSGEGSVRTVALERAIPLERNKVTLIRIYVLGENVFSTGVDFAVTVDTVWDGSYNIDGEID